MAIIYHNPRCSTSRAALALLRERGYQPHIIEYLSAPPAPEELAKLIQQAGLSVSQAIRTKEARYTELGLDREGVSDAQKLAAIAENPILLNRPFVVTEKGVRLARPLSTLDDIL